MNETDSVRKRAPRKQTGKTTVKKTTSRAAAPTSTGVVMPPLTRDTGRKEFDAVARCQLMLHLFGQQLQPDGFYGPQTQRSVEEFQATVGLPVDGEMGPRDWELLLCFKRA